MNILVLPGDDIGPEVTAAAVAVLQHASAVHALGLRFETRDIGMASHRRSGTTLPDSGSPPRSPMASARWTSAASSAPARTARR
jgi:isocitrate/isopropylmalate dehydrogenase